jgi:cytochrome c2
MFEMKKSPLILAGALAFALAPSISFAGAGHGDSEAAEPVVTDAHAEEAADAHDDEGAEPHDDEGAEPHDDEGAEPHDDEEGAGGGGGHDAHAHDFGTMDQLTATEKEHLDEFMADAGLILPNMSSSRGRDLFATKGCAVCHSVNGVGGEDAPTLDAADMPGPMNVFEFSARMWRGAPAMVVLQEDELGEFISLTGEELADLVAFAHDKEEQAKFTIDQIPEEFRELLEED